MTPAKPLQQRPEPSVLTDPILQYMLAQRQALLMIVDSIERALHIEPTTAEIRRKFKEEREKIGSTVEGKP